MHMCKDKLIRRWWDKVVHRKCYTTTGRRKWSSQKGNDKKAVNRTYCNMSNRANDADLKERNSEEERNKKFGRKKKTSTSRGENQGQEWEWRKIAMRFVSLEDCFWVPTEDWNIIKYQLFNQLTHKLSRKVLIVCYIKTLTSVFNINPLATNVVYIWSS